VKEFPFSSRITKFATKVLDALLLLKNRWKNPRSVDRLPDLYLDGDFPKEVLIERKTRLDELVFKLGKEQNDIRGHICHVPMTDDQLAYIKEYCTKIRTVPTFTLSVKSSNF